MEQIAGRRLVRLEPFGEEQVEAFLVRLFEGDEGRARRWLDQIRVIRDLLGLSHNPRMLAFIAELDEDQLHDAAVARGTITSAELYRMLLTRWPEHEVDRSQPQGRRALSLSLGESWDAVTRLAWRCGNVSTERWRSPT